jgi:hypothetical protein
MEYDHCLGGIEPAAIESLRIPGAFDEAVHETALDIDALLKQDESPVATLNSKLATYRDLALSNLLKHHGKQSFDIVPWFRWPPSLYIPKNANASDYWITSAPDDHRYGLDWTSPASATPNMASRLDGTLFSFSQLDNANANRAQSSESGVGIFYQPPMTLGVIDLQPLVNCTGTLRTFLEFFPELAAGYVEGRAQLMLAAWQQIPGGFDLLGFKQFDVATSGRRDQTFRPELQQFQRTYDGPSLSAPFVVQRGRTYLLGVVSRISVTSTLTSNTGRPLPPISNTTLRVWGAMSCVVPQINVLTKRIDIA